MSDLHATAEEIADEIFRPIGAEPTTSQWVLLHLTDDPHSKLRGHQSVLGIRHLTDTDMDVFGGLMPNGLRNEPGPLPHMLAAFEVAEPHTDGDQPVLSNMIGWTEAFIHELIELNPECGITGHADPNGDQLDYQWIRRQLHDLFTELQIRMPIETEDPTP